MISLRDVYKSFGTKHVLNGFSLDVMEGETMVIIGFSGSGKSVAIKHIVGLLEPDSGDVLVDGISVPSLTRRELYAAAGAHRLRLSVRGAVRLDDRRRQRRDGSRKQARPDAEARSQRACRKRSSWSTCRTSRTTLPSNSPAACASASGIARAIALRPKYILYDEPTTGLDPVTSAVIDELMLRMQRQLGVTSIVITHDMRSAYTVGTRIAMLYEGRVRQVGTVARSSRTQRSRRAPVHRGARVAAHAGTLDGRPRSQRHRCRAAPV